MVLRFLTLATFSRDSGDMRCEGVAELTSGRSFCYGKKFNAALAAQWFVLSLRW